MHTLRKIVVMASTTTYHGGVLAQVRLASSSSQHREYVSRSWLFVFRKNKLALKKAHREKTESTLDSYHWLNNIH